MNSCRKVILVSTLALSAFAAAADDAAAKVLSADLMSNDKVSKLRALDSLLGTELRIENSSLALALYKRGAQVAIGENRTKDAAALYQRLEKVPGLSEKDRVLVLYEQAQATALSENVDEAFKLFKSLREKHATQLTSSQLKLVDNWLQYLRKEAESTRRQFSDALVKELKDLCEIPFDKDSYVQAMNLIERWVRSGAEAKSGRGWMETQARENKSDTAFMVESFRYGSPQKIPREKLNELDKATIDLPDDRRMRLLYALGLSYISNGQDVDGLSYMKRVANQPESLDFDGDLRAAAMRAMVLVFDDLGNEKERQFWQRRLVSGFAGSPIAEFPESRFQPDQPPVSESPWLRVVPIGLAALIAGWLWSKVRK